VLVAVAADGGGLHPQRVDFVEDLAAVARPDAVDEAVARMPDRQRRSAVRIPAVLPYTFSAVIAERDWGHGATVDLSVGGALVQGIEAGLPGDQLKGRLALPAVEAPVKAQLRVLRVTADGQRAVRVESIDLKDLDRIAKFIARRQRELLRARAG
jgi:c-di-GMP-binding flagellar brake protein YcgR